MNKPCGGPPPHDPHPHSDLEWRDGDGAGPTDALMADLAQAESENVHSRGCQACDVLEATTEPARTAVRAALDGTIGRDKLVTILSRHGYTIGRRAIERHRQEGH